MKFWTFQRKSIIDELKDEESYRPNFNTQVLYEGVSPDAYKYIAKQYGSVGLIFGYVGNSKHNNISSPDELYEMLKEEGNPGGTAFPSETHYLLEMEIPNDKKIMVIDFYKFSDLMFFVDEENEEEIELSKSVLFEPNNPDGTWQLKIGHINEIKSKWIIGKYIPKNLK